jgi:hypothetical protein
VYWHEGKAYVVGKPGNEYQVNVRSRGEEVLAVVSVDGVNVVTGETAAAQQSGYLLSPGRSMEIRGWRKSLESIAAFYFTELPDSYAARTGRPENVGVIGVATDGEELSNGLAGRHGGNLDTLGRMADLIEDASPIRLGTEGRYKGVHFAVIGRIQLRYAAGVWNEWHILFDDMRGGWLSDANGEYLISFLQPPGAALPEFATLMPNDELTLAGQDFVVTDLEEAMCISGQGELPFAFGAGYPAQLADLRTTDESAAAFASRLSGADLRPPLLRASVVRPVCLFSSLFLTDWASRSPVTLILTVARLILSNPVSSQIRASASPPASSY